MAQGVGLEFKPQHQKKKKKPKRFYHIWGKGRMGGGRETPPCKCTHFFLHDPRATPPQTSIQHHAQLSIILKESLTHIAKLNYCLAV
jgi:hypothetical protein